MESITDERFCSVLKNILIVMVDEFEYYIVFHTALCMKSVQKAERGYCPKIMLRLNMI